MASSVTVDLVCVADSLNLLQSCAARALSRLPPEVRSKAIVIVQHIRKDTELAICQMRDAGLNIPLVLGISYSVDADALNGLVTAGVPVHVGDVTALPERIEEHLNTADDGSVILVDVGGYAANLVAKSEYARKLIGVVEETNNGLWRYERTMPLVPIVQIARCPNKGPENVQVGEAIVKAAERALQSLGRDVTQERFAVLGYGGIGENVMGSLARRSLTCATFDINRGGLKNPDSALSGRSA